MHVLIYFTVLKGHFVAFACSKLGINNPTDTPADCPNLRKGEEKLSYIVKLTQQVVDEYSLNSDAILGD